jgi:peptidoglycan/xylan/chitin deacetylase (PgdA/CDA1 family)
MVIIVVKPWQARLIMGFAFALFLAAGYRFSEEAALTPAMAPPDSDAPLFEVPGVEGMVSLAINVDWGSEDLPAMLQELEAHGAKAIFFLTGNWVEKNGELARTLVEKGHEVGNHGRQHDYPRRLSDAALVEHIAGNSRFLEEAVGRVSKLYAPPYGEWDRRIVRQAARSGHLTVMWTIDTLDWKDPTPEQIKQRVLPKVRAGSIILMHPRPNTVAALPGLLEGLKAKGLAAVTLSTMLAASGRAYPGVSAP